MILTPGQKKYIKKHIRNESILQIAQAQNINEKEIIDYLKKRWGEEKLNLFLSNHTTQTNKSVKTYSIRSFIKDNRTNFLILFIIVLIAYGISLNNVFLSDDIAEIVQNPNVGKFSDIFAHGLGFIRPLLYWLAFHIGGLNPVLFRSINIFFHIGSVFLVYTLFCLLNSKRLAFFVAGIFAVHPAISEAVVWISGGLYPQYSFFFLLSFILYLLSKNNKLFYWLSVLSFFFAFSHPQMALALFLVFPLWEFVFGNLKKNWLKTLPFLLISIAYVFIVLSNLPERETTLQSTHYQQKGIDNPIMITIIAISSYFELTFFPNTLTLYHSELAFSQFQFIIRAIITLTFFIGILISFRKNEHSSAVNKHIFFWASFFLLALAPTLTPFRLNWVVAERYLYLPIIGILAILGLGFEKLTLSFKFKKAAYILLTIIIFILTARTIIRDIDWKNEDNLWIATGKTSPSSPNTHNNLGDVYGRQGDKQAALREFQKAIELKPNYGDAYHNLANTYNELKQPDKALENYQNAIKYNPNLWQSYQNIAAVYFSQKKYDLTIDNLQKAIAINPRNLNLKGNLGVVYLIIGEKANAKEYFNQVLSLDPNNQLARQGLVEANK